MIVAGNTTRPQVESAAPVNRENQRETCKRVNYRVQNLVTERSKAKGSTFLVLLTLTRWADDNGHAWPTVSAIALNAHMSERSTQYQLAKLERMGELEITEESSPIGSSMCRISVVGGAPLPGVKTVKRQRGAKSKTKIAPKVSKESPSNSSPDPASISNLVSKRSRISSNTDKAAPARENGTAIANAEQKLLQEIRKDHVPDPHQFWTWYAPITVQQLRDGMIWLSVPNGYFIDKLRPQTAMVLTAARAVLPGIRGIRWVNRSEGFGGETAGLL